MKRSEEGAISLAELIVAMMLASILILAMVKLADNLEKSATNYTAAFNGEQLATNVITTAVNDLSSGAPLGLCTAPGPGTPEPNCLSTSYSGPIISAAADTGPTQGFCYYNYAGVATGGAPHLSCIVAYQGSGGTAQLYVFDYKPSGGTTYTSCDPKTCFGPSAPQPGSLPPSPGSCTSQCHATLAGTAIVGSGGMFEFYNLSGSAIAPSQTSQIGQVMMYIDEPRAAFGSKGEYHYTYTGAVSAAAYREASSWQAVAG